MDPRFYPDDSEINIAKWIVADPDRISRVRQACKTLGKPLSRNAIWQWRKYKSGIPSGRVMAVARAFKLPKYRIRPDLFPAPKRNGQHAA